MRLLLVEDCTAAGRAFQRILQCLGHEVDWYQTLAASVQACAATPYDLVITDIGLPDGDGRDLIRLCGKPELRAIVVSAYVQPSDIRKSREMGYLEHLTKPLDLGLLRAMLDRHGLVGNSA